MTDRRGVCKRKPLSNQAAIKWWMPMWFAKLQSHSPLTDLQRIIHKIPQVVNQCPAVTSLLKIVMFYII
jgi:hypothetical protein